MSQTPRVTVVLDGRRQWPPATHPSDGEALRVPAWEEGPGFEPLDAVASLRLAGAADALVLAVEPESVLHYAQLAHQLGRRDPFFVPGPVAGSEGELAELLSFAERSGVPLLLATRLGASVGLRRLRALSRKGFLGAATSLSVTLVAPVPRGFDSAARFKKDFDALLGAVAELFALFRLLGLEAPAFELRNQLGDDYFRELHLESRGGALPCSVRFLPEREGVAERVDLIGPDGRLEWHHEGGSERVTMHVRGRTASEQPGAAPLIPTLLREHQEALAAGIPSPWQVSGLAAELARATEIVDDYLYGHEPELRLHRRETLRAAGAGPGAPFEGFGVSSQAGFALAFLASLEQSRSFQVRTPRPFRALLVRAPVLDERTRTSLFPSLALGQLAGALRSMEVDVQCIDLALPFQRSVAAGVSQAQATSELLEVIRRELAWPSVDLLGIAVEETRSIEPTLALLAGGLRDVAAHVVLGGRGSWNSDYALRGSKLVDSVISGEGELGLMRLVHHLCGRAAAEAVPGLWKTDWELHRRIPPVLPDFDFHPLPVFDGIDLCAYDSGKPLIPSPFLPYLFALGCPYKCAFCANDSAQKGRYRTPARTAQELVALVKTYGVRHFYFLNNLINNDPRAFAELLEALDPLDLGITWADCARPYGIDLAQMRRLRRAGCVELTFGIDTGSQRLSNLMRKGYKIEKACETIEHACAAGIKPVVNLIVGMPHETERDFDDTMRFVERMRGYVSFSVAAYVYTHGSPLYENPRKFGLRRKGELFDEHGGARWREHRAARELRYQLISEVAYAPSSSYMPGFDGYQPGQEPKGSSRPRGAGLTVLG